MEVIGQDKLDAFMRGNAKNRARIRAWLAEVGGASWRTTSEVRGRFPSADFLAGNRVVFDVGGNNARIVARIDYERQVLQVRFVGTHAEYDKIDARTI